MPAAGIALLALLATGYAALAPLRRAFVAMVAVTFLVPATLTIPIGLPFVSVSRLTMLGLLFNIAGRVRRGRLDAAVLRPTRVHVAFLLYLAVALVTGVATARLTLSPTAAAEAWLRFLDQLAFFATALAAIRAIDDHLWVARAFAVLVGVSAVIAVGERAVEASYARWFFLHVPDQLRAVAANPLERRAGVGPVRVRAAANFALEFGWYTAFFLPLLVAVAARSRSWFLRAIPVVAAVALLWSNSRSALVGVGAGFLLAVALSRGDHRLTIAVTVGALAAGLLYLAQPSLREPFDLAGRTGAVTVREERLPIILDLTSERPYTGLGFEGLRARGITTVDSSYLIDYGELGVVGVLALIVLIATAIGAALPGLRAPPGAHRALSAAIIAGMVMAAGGAAAFSLFRVLASGRLFWVIAALGVALAERAVRLAPADATASGGPRLHPAARVALPVVGVAIGLVLAAAVPTRGVADVWFESLTIGRLAPATEPQLFAGKILSGTVCAAIDAHAEDIHAEIQCKRNPNGIGLGSIRVEAGDRAEVQAALEDIAVVATRTVPRIRGHLDGPIVEARPTWARTAPVWLGLAGLAAAVLLPAGRRRRKVDTRARVLSPA